jgi:hypothetical protein
MSENQSNQSQVHVTAFRGTEGLVVKSQFKGYSVPLCAGGSVLTQRQSYDKETNGQHDTHDRSSGQPGALLQISYFTADLQ